MEHYKISISSGSIEFSSHDKNWVEEKEKQYSETIKSLLQKKPEQKSPHKTSPPEKINPPKQNVIGKMPINEFYRTYIHSKNIKSRWKYF